MNKERLVPPPFLRLTCKCERYRVRKQMNRSWLFLSCVDVPILSKELCAHTFLIRKYGSAINNITLIKSVSLANSETFLFFLYCHFLFGGILDICNQGVKLHKYWVGRKVGNCKELLVQPHTCLPSHTTSCACHHVCSCCKEQSHN